MAAAPSTPADADVEPDPITSGLQQDIQHGIEECTALAGHAGGGSLKPADPSRRHQPIHRTAFKAAARHRRRSREPIRAR